jgi:hypothetical protein
VALSYIPNTHTGTLAMDDSASGAMRDQVSFGDGKVRRSVLNPVAGGASDIVGLLTSSIDPGAAR